MITVQQLSKKYGLTSVVHNISFEVPEGETLVLLGTSGCGKTTTLRMINRLTEPTSGTVIINGENVQEQPPEELRRKIGYVLQNTGLFPHYTVAENIALVPQLLHWPKEKIRKRTDELLYKLQLPQEYCSAYPAQLSGGQQKRVGLARALAANPPVLLMDEPFGALDPIIRSGIRKEFKELDELKQKTVILVTHDVQEAFELGNLICLMDKGRIVQMGTPAELVFHPQNKFVEDFFHQQRLQLELKSVQLKAVWQQLPFAKNRAIPVFEADKNLWDVLELLAQRKGAEALIYVAKECEPNEVKEVSFETIFTIFNQFKQSV